MIEIGCLARYFNSYEHEVTFARENGFQLLQIWYDKYGIQNQDVKEQTNTIKQYNYPAIIHAVLDINMIEEHIPNLIKVLKTLEHKELIIHPVCKSEPITETTIYKLADIVKATLVVLANESITLIGEGSLVFNRGDSDYTIPDKRIYLSRMIVKAEYRNRGIGGVIIDFLIDYAKRLGYEEMSLGVDTNNLNAWHLYEKKGFTNVIFKGEDEDGEYVKLLRKII